jgi:hypothetical protein
VDIGRVDIEDFPFVEHVLKRVRELVAPAPGERVGALWPNEMVRIRSPWILLGIAALAATKENVSKLT